MFKELVCYLFGHRGKLDSRPYLVVEDGRPRKETMICWRCERCGKPLIDMGLGRDRAHLALSPNEPPR